MSFGHSFRKADYETKFLFFYYETKFLKLNLGFMSKFIHFLGTREPVKCMNFDINPRLSLRNFVS